MRNARRMLAWMMAATAPMIAAASALALTPQPTRAQAESTATRTGTAIDNADTIDIDTDFDTTEVVDLANLERPSAIEERLRHTIADHESHLTRIVRHGTLRRGNFTLAEHDSLVGHLLVLRGNTDIFGKLLGNLVALDGDVSVHPGGSVTGDVLVLNGKMRDSEGTIGGIVSAFGAPVIVTRPKVVTTSKTELVGEGMMGIVAWSLVLLTLGLTLVVLARSKLDVIAETASHSIGRSFAVGFVGQALLLPTFGIVIVGLTVSIVGILLLPFVIVGYIVLAIVGLIGGYLAVAYAIGETYNQRQVAEGAVAPRNGYRHFVLGLAALLLPWLVWVLFRWVPVAGAMLWGLAFLIAWMAVTIGFGAMLLSRAGSRTNFTGRES